MNNDKIHTIVRKSLDKDVETLSANIQSRLTRARTEALENSSSNINHKFKIFSLFSNRSVQVATALASVTFVAISSFSVININNKDTQNTIEIAKENLTSDEPFTPQIVDSDVGKDFFLTEEDLDFFENLELYQWLDSEFKTS